MNLPPTLPLSRDVAGERTNATRRVTLFTPVGELADVVTETFYATGGSSYGVIGVWVRPERDGGWRVVGDVDGVSREEAWG